MTHRPLDFAPAAIHTITADVHIRPAVADDLRLLEWFGEFWHYREKFEMTYAAQMIGRRLLLVADLNGYPVGRIAILFEGGNPLYANGRTRAYLYSFQVMSFLQGMGIGGRLLDTAENHLRQQGYQHAVIAVAQDNAGALRLYERRGYRQFGTDPGRWSYTDPDGVVHHVDEPCWLLKKRL